MQLLVIHTVEGYDSFKLAFDDGAENRSHAGLGVMQIWTEAGGNRVLILYRVSDRAAAENHLSGEMQLVSEAGGVTGTTHYFLETA